MKRNCVFARKTSALLLALLAAVTVLCPPKATATASMSKSSAQQTAAVELYNRNLLKQEEHLALYLDDEKTDVTLLVNRAGNYDGCFADVLLPMNKTLQTWGFTLGKTKDGRIKIRPDQEAYLLLSPPEEGFIHVQYYRTESAELETERDIPCTVVNGVTYLTLPDLGNLMERQDAYGRSENKLHIYSDEYFLNHRLSSNKAGKRMDVNIIVNDVKINAPVYECLDYPDDPRYALVKLAEAGEALGTATLHRDGEVYTLAGERGNDIVINPGVSFLIGESSADPYIACLLDGALYIRVDRLKTLFNMDRKAEGKDIRYYEPSYRRSDIPGSLEESYAFLDAALTAEDIAYIKAMEEENVSAELHFSLGLWIRNNWLYPSNPSLNGQMYETGLSHTDDHSSLILRGYHRYLNGKDASMEAVLAAKRGD